MKIAIAQPNYIIGDLEGNYKKSLTFIDKAKADKCDLIVFPELSLTGYPPKDLLLDYRFIHDQMDYAHKLAEESTKEFSIIFGCAFDEADTGNLYNSAVYANDGMVSDRANKQLLPTYNVFDEQRYFVADTESTIISHYVDHKCFNLGMLICEDIWAEEDSKYATNPIEKLFRKGNTADLIISINASPSNVHKADVRHEMLSRIALKYRTPIVYVNQVGANDDLVFDGQSSVYNENGSLVYRLNAFAEDYKVIEFDKKFNPDTKAHLVLPQVMQAPTLMEDGPEIMYEHIVLGIRDYVKKIGLSKVVIGESGGIDSALVTALAASALGAENVIAVTMPSQYSSDGSWGDSKILCDNFGIKLYTHPISEIFNEYIKQYKIAFGKEPSGLAQENIQARIRGNILMEYSNDMGALVLSTSNKSEASVGYTTLYGDMSGGIAPISDLYKTEVWELSDWFNHFQGSEMIPDKIIHKEPSAELRPGQKDTDSLPPYPVLDAILKLYIELQFLSEEDRKECEDIVARQTTPEMIKKVISLVDRAEFKRRQAPPTIRVHNRAFGSGRQLPIVQRYRRTKLI